MMRERFHTLRLYLRGVTYECPTTRDEEGRLNATCNQVPGWQACGDSQGIAFSLKRELERRRKDATRAN